MTNKDLLRQYVNSGVQINDYQFKQLPSNLLKTYLRQRAMSGYMTWAEYQYMPEELEDIFLKNTTSHVSSMVNMFKKGRITDEKIYKIIDLKGKTGLNRDPSLVSLMITYSHDNLQIAKKLIDTLGSDVEPDLLSLILHKSEIDYVRPILIEYFIDNYLIDSQSIGDLYENIVGNLLASASYDTVKFAHKIVDILGERITKFECVHIVDYIFSRTYQSDDFDYDDEMIYFINKVKNYPNAGDLIYHFLKKLRKNEIHKVLSSMDRNDLGKLSDTQIKYIAIKPGREHNGNDMKAFADAFEKYCPLDKLDDNEIAEIKKYAEMYQDWIK